MEKSIFLNRRFFFAVLTIFVFVCGLQMMEPASAAKWKMISKGHKKTGQGFDIAWKTYKKSKNYVKIRGFDNAYGENFHNTIWLKKISKTKLKIIQKPDKSKKEVFYVKTSLSAVKFYWKERKKGNYFISWNE